MPPPSRPSRSARLCDAFVLLYALWTLCCNGVVFLGGGLHDLLLVAGPALGICLLWLLWRARSSAPDEGDAAPEPEARRPLSSLAIALLLSAALSAGFAWGGSVRLFWWGSVLFLLIALLATLRQPARALAAPRSSRAWEAWGWLAAVLFALFPLFARRPSPDDGFYTNVAVNAVELPAAPLLRFDTLHGVEGLPVMYSVYQVHSFELLGAALAYLSGIEPIRVMYWGLGSLFGFLLVLANARLLRLLAPRSWLWCLLVLVGLLILEKASPQSYGTFALLRIHQGKTALLMVILPLVTAYALEYSQRPGPRSWLLLFAAMVSAVGMSSTAIWLAPLLLGLVLLAGTSQARSGLRRLGLGLCSSVHAVALGLWFASAALHESAVQSAGAEGVRPRTRMDEELTESAPLVERAAELVLGDGLFALLALFAMLGAWAFATSTRVRRLFLLLPLGTLVLLLNPYTAIEVARKLTGGPTFWRVLWLLPIPLLCAWLVVQVLGILRNRTRAHPALLAVLPLLLLGIIAFQGRWTGIHWRPFTLGLEEETLEHARRISAEVEPGSMVLAPERIGVYLLQLPGHFHPLVSGRNWLILQTDELGAEEVDRRLRLIDIVMGLLQPGAQEQLLAAISDYDLRAVSFERRTVNSRDVLDALRLSGFRELHASDGYRTWVRP